MASRRAKGKARDPREGPGLGLKGLPIELSSDSEEEEVVNSLEVGAVLSEDSDVSSQEGSYSDTDYTESESDEGGEASYGLPGTSTQHIVTLSSSENSGQGQEVDRNTGFAVLRDRGTSDEFQYPVQSESPIAVDVELVDPWEGPRTFAEDYYSGVTGWHPASHPIISLPLLVARLLSLYGICQLCQSQAPTKAEFSLLQAFYPCLFHLNHSTYWMVMWLPPSTTRKILLSQLPGRITTLSKSLVCCSLTC
ncbi:hypothetical protein BJV77DRAFT_249105 [Russula vinacea]|nr:hypothetical protein BJV77DRAFT_249105 [Russula vinacea]